MKLRSIELVLPKAADAAAFMTDVWGMAQAEVRGQTHYLRGSGPLPYLLALTEGPNSFVRTVTWLCSEAELESLRERVSASGLRSTPTTSDDPGGGHGLIVELPEGELFRFLTSTSAVASIEGRDLPVQLTHVVLNSKDAERTCASRNRCSAFASLTAQRAWCSSAAMIPTTAPHSHAPGSRR